MSDLVANPEDRFSQNEAHLYTADTVFASFRLLHCFLKALLARGKQQEDKDPFKVLCYKGNDQALCMFTSDVIVVVERSMSARTYNNLVGQSGAFCTVSF